MEKVKQLRPGKALFCAVVLLAAAVVAAFASPSWWTSRNVIEADRHPADYAPLTLGQLKFMATNAYDEMEESLPNGAGSAVETLVQAFTTTNSYQVANVGQLKYVAKPFYDRLIAEGYTNSYPWTAATTDDVDYAACTIGQMKSVFDFELAVDDDSDSLPDWWEIHHFGAITNYTGSADPDDDDLVNSNEFKYAGDPNDADTDNDGLTDGWEIGYFQDFDETTAGDPDSDGMTNGFEFAYELDPTESADAVQDADGDGYFNVYECAHEKNPQSASSYPVPAITATNGVITIQAAINAATNDYDIVMVGAGLYSGVGNRAIDFAGKKIMVVSQSGAAWTIVDCESAARGFYFHTGETRHSVLKGFTVRNGKPPSSGDCGGGICCSGADPSILDCTVEDSEPGIWGFGGGMYFSSSSAFVSNCIVSDNTCPNSGGGMYISGSADTVTVAQCEITDNESKDDSTTWGGGICVNAGNIALYNSLVSDNTVATGYAGGIGLIDPKNSLIAGCTIAGNSILSSDEGAGNGGGLAIWDDCDNVVVSGCFISSNSAPRAGGGIWIADGSATISDCTIVYNEAAPEAVTGGSNPAMGGGIFGNGTGEPVIRNCDISYNTADSGGGGGFGIECSSATTPAGSDFSPSIEACTIEWNTAGTNGGGVVVQTNEEWTVNDGWVSMINCGVIGNQSGQSGGGVYVQKVPGVALDPPTLNLQYCTIAGNHAGDIAGGLYVGDEAPSLGTKLLLQNSIVWSNWPNILVVTNLYSNYTHCVEYSCIANGYLGIGSGSGILTTDPLLVPDGCHLTGTNSPVCDAGVTNGITEDIHGETRPSGGGPEYGCDEWLDTDLDFLPNWWEFNYWEDPTNGLPAVDSDSDGITNTTEYVNNLDPTSGDTDNDGAPDKAELDQGTNPRIDAGDFDGDGLSDHAEIYYGTGTNDWDSDDDLIGDGWEVQMGLCPTNSADAALDNDSDGLTNFWEYIYGTSVATNDSDGDGVQDYTEIIAGSDPADADDGGNPTNCVMVELVVGDHSSSESERWELHMGNVRHQSSEFGSVDTNEYAFVKGKQYSFEINWLATSNSLADPSDYDYTARIGGKPVGSTSTNWMYGTGFIINDPDLILGVHSVGEGLSEPTCAGKEGAVYVIELQITEPDSSPANDNNFVFGSTTPGTCIVAATGTTGIPDEDPHLEWTLEAISGSTLTNNPDPAIGASITFSYTTLPASNADFGNKALTLMHTDSGCSNVATVQVFFGRDATNNPGVVARNWYYYWEGGNVVSDLADFEYDNEAYYGYYNPGDGKLYVCNAAPTSNDGPISVTHKTQTNLVFEIGASGTGIDCCAETCAHEKEHKRIDNDYGGQTDTDGDGLPDAVETNTAYAAYQFDVYDPDTFDLEHTIHPDYATYGDQEFLCRVEEEEPGNVTTNADWSDTNGKNWDD